VCGEVGKGKGIPLKRRRRREEKGIERGETSSRRMRILPSIGRH